MERVAPHLRTRPPGLGPGAVETLARLCADGYSKQVMIAHYHCLKAHFAEHGGKGWVYTPTEVGCLREAGVTEDQLNDILVENPKRISAV